MRVGIVTPRYPPTMHGGGEVSVQLLAEQLTEDARVEAVRVFSFDGRETETVDGLPVERLASVPGGVFEVSNAVAALALRRRGAFRDLDVVHAYNVALNPAVGYLGARTGTPTVATLNSYDCFPKSVTGTEPSLARRAYEATAMPTTGRVLHRFAKRIDAFVALSRATRDVYREHGYADERIEVVGNMYDPSFDPATNHEDGDSTTLLYVGSLIPEKGVQYLVRALESLPDEYRLRVVGDGPERERLTELASKLGVDDRVEFTGNVPHDQVQGEYARADVFVHPGVWPEPFGRTLLEAMRSELPVVTTDVGGPTDIVPDDDLRCPPRSPEALAATIETAAERDGVGKRNREHVEREYAPERIRGEIVGVYESVV